MNTTKNALSGKTPENKLEDTILDSAEPLVKEFERLLSSELHLLSRGIADGLESIAIAKKSLVENLSRIETDLIWLFDSHPNESRVVALRDRLKNCRIENQSNHTLVMMELKHSQKSLDLLRSVMNMDDLSLYSERGEVDIKREKRKFGSA